MTTNASTELNGQAVPVASASEAFRNHEDRLGVLEELAHELRRAFPGIADHLSLPRVPHLFTEPDNPAEVVLSTDSAIAGLRSENEELRKMVAQILDRLPGLPAPSSPPDPRPGPPAGAGPEGPPLLNSMGSPS